MAKKYLSIALHTSVIDWATQAAAKYSVSRNEFVEEQLRKALDKKDSFVAAINAYITSYENGEDMSEEKAMAMQIRPEVVEKVEKWAGMFKLTPKFIIMVALTAAKFNDENR